MPSPTFLTGSPVSIHLYHPPRNWGQKVTRIGGPQVGAFLILSEPLTNFDKLCPYVVATDPRTRGEAKRLIANNELLIIHVASRLSTLRTLACVHTNPPHA